MFNFIKRNRVFILSFISLVFILTSLSTPAYAWKLKTHAYIANIVIDDAKDGKVWIPPYGEFEVRPEVAEAIKLCPTYFRGGSIGPDGFPDFWTGQSFIHPNTNPYLVLLWNNLPPYNAYTGPVSTTPGVHVGYATSDTPKRQAWAFTFGYFSHCAGDMWAHDWVNIYAGKAFPGLSEIKADFQNNLNVIAKHISIENTLDKRIPLSAGTIEVPNDFVLNTLVLNRTAKSLGMNKIASYFVGKYFDKLPYKNQKVTVAGISTPVKTYNAEWFDDLESGFKSTSSETPGWMEANKKAIKDVMELNKGMIGSLGGKLGLWSVTYFFDMLGFPSITRFVGETIGSNQAQVEAALDAVGLGEAERSEITSDIVNVLLKTTLGMDKTTFDQVWTKEMTQQLFPGATFNEIMADMGTPPSEATWANAWTNQAAFDSLINSINGPLYNSVITTKIMMLKSTELERLLGGKKLSGLTGEVAILGVLKGIDFSKQFDKPDGLYDNWLGYGMTLSQIQNSGWRPVFPVIFKPYGPRDMTRQEIWSASLDANHKWGAIYPVTAQMIIKPTFAGGRLWNLGLASATSNSLTVSWNKYPYADFGKYVLTITCPSANTTASFDVANINTTTYTFQNLTPGKGYSIFLKAKSPSGQVLGEEWSLGTTTPLPTFAGGSLWNLRLNSVSSNSITMSWDKYPFTDGFGKYVLTLNCPSANTTATFDVANINTTTYTFPNLTPEKYYTIFIKAKSPGGQTLGEEWSIGTTTALPTFAGGSLWNIRLTGATKDSISISWDKYPYADSFGKYVLIINCTSANTTATFEVANINTTTYTFRNLTPDQPYAIFLKAKSPGGQALGQEWSIGTRTAKPPALPSVRLKVLSSNQPVSGATVEVKKVNTVVSNVTTGSDGFTPYVEFEPTVSYYFAVKNQDCYADYASGEYHMPSGATGAQTNWYVINLYPKMPWGGKVHDSNGKPLSGVTVTTSGKTATTDSSGSYNFGQWLPVSNVTITFSKSGYTTKQLQGTVQPCGLTRKLIIPDCVLERPVAQTQTTTTASQQAQQQQTPPVIKNLAVSLEQAKVNQGIEVKANISDDVAVTRIESYLLCENYKKLLADEKPNKKAVAFSRKFKATQPGKCTITLKAYDDKGKCYAEKDIMIEDAQKPVKEEKAVLKKPATEEAADVKIIEEEKPKNEPVKPKIAVTKKTAAKPSSQKLKKTEEAAAIEKKEKPVIAKKTEAEIVMPDVTIKQIKLESGNAKTLVAGRPLAVTVELDASMDMKGPFVVLLEVSSTTMSQKFKEGIEEFIKGKKTFKWDLLKKPQAGKYKLNVEIINEELGIKKKRTKPFTITEKEAKPELKNKE